MNPFKNFFLRVGGDTSKFGLEHRIFNISSFIITIFGAIAGAGNYFTGLHMMTVWLSVVGVLLSGVVFYTSRIRQIFTSSVIFVYLVAVISVLGSMFFFNGGVQGAIFYLIIMLLTIFLLIVPTAYQKFIAIVLFLTLFLLITLEFLFPHLIIHYHSTDEMLLDHIFTMFYVVFFTSAIVIMFRRQYLEDRGKMLLQNSSLQLLNEKVIAQKNELEEKAKELERTIEAANERNKYIEMLLKELNHRVKNNLQLVSSLLLKQANSSSDMATKTALLDTKSRLLSLILLHQRLYGHDNATSIFMPQYLKELSESILISYTDFGEENIIYDIDDVWLSVDLAISVGLIANELITNSFKHAFLNVSEPTLCVSFKRSETDFILSIKDNGIGMEESKESPTFGLELIGLLTKQLKGKLEKACHINEGCCFSITFSELSH
ncbi:MAG: sensor histidine kinase [Bacteroidota bacterium]